MSQPKENFWTVKDSDGRTVNIYDDTVKLIHKADAFQEKHENTVDLCGIGVDIWGNDPSKWTGIDIE